MPYKVRVLPEAKLNPLVIVNTICVIGFVLRHNATVAPVAESARFALINIVLYVVELL